MKKHITFALAISIIFMTMGLMADENEDFKKGGELFQQGKFAEALKHVEESIAKYGETEQWLMGKFFILNSMKEYEKALETGLKLDEKSTQKNPFIALEIAGIYQDQKKDNAQTVSWLEKAVERGFDNYYFLESSPNFAPVRTHPAFATLMKKIKSNLGLNVPAKDFTVTLTTGEPFILFKYKGKVILIDFWASWCAPCVKEMPNVQKVYEKYKNQGFEIIGISLDKDKNKMDTYLKDSNIQWKIAFSGKFWQDETAGLYNVRSIPSTWLVDKKGILRHTGITGEGLDEVIGQLVKE